MAQTLNCECTLPHIQNSFRTKMFIDFVQIWKPATIWFLKLHNIKGSILRAQY